MRARFLPFRLAAVLFVIAFFICDPRPTSLQAAEVTKLSERELHQLFPGRFYAIAYGFLKIRITALADGSLFAQQIGKSDTGIWRIRSGQLCIKFSKWLKGRMTCSAVSEQGRWYRTKAVAFKKLR
jgi:hypothetical protein